MSKSKRTRVISSFDGIPTPPLTGPFSHIVETKELAAKMANAGKSLTDAYLTAHVRGLSLIRKKGDQPEGIE